MMKIHPKMKAFEWPQHFSHYKSMGIFQANSADLGLIWPKFDPIHDFIAVLVTCKNKDGPIKNEGPRLLTTLYFDFSDAQWQLTQ